MSFAETGRGPASRTHPRDPRRLALIVPGAIAYVAVDETQGILRVERMFPRR